MKKLLVLIIIPILSCNLQKEEDKPYIVTPDEISLISKIDSCEKNNANEKGIELCDLFIDKYLFSPSVDNIVVKKGDFMLKKSIEKMTPTNKWEHRYFVDDFGDPTNDGYISTSRRIVGRFSNSATTNSDLGVKFIIGTDLIVSFDLYEYNRSTPVTEYSKKEYTVKVKDEDSNVSTFTADIYSSRFYLNKTSSKKLIDFFKSDKTLKFNIVNNNNRNTSYNFELKDFEGFQESYEKLTK